VLAVQPHDLADRLLVGRVRGEVLDLVSLRAQLVRGLLERVRLAGGDRQSVAALAEQVGEREADPAGGSGDDGGAIRH
jgi:hypothetical protein